MIVLEYDNQGYMNTGHQLSYATPLGHATATSHVGPAQTGKGFHHKDTAQIMAATHIPYVFTSVEGLGTDLVRKAAKAQWYARHGGFAYGKFLSACPLSWRYDERYGTKVVHAAVDCCFFPVYEVEKDKTTITYDPEARGKRIPLSQWLGMMGKTRHLLKPEYSDILQAAEKEVERRWRCQVCGYIYDPELGDPDSGVSTGTAFEDLPDDWVCPSCGAAKDQFEKL